MLGQLSHSYYLHGCSHGGTYHSRNFSIRLCKWRLLLSVNSAEPPGATIATCIKANKMTVVIIGDHRSTVPRETKTTTLGRIVAIVVTGDHHLSSVKIYHTHQDLAPPNLCIAHVADKMAGLQPPCTLQVDIATTIFTFHPWYPSSRTLKTRTRKDNKQGARYVFV